MGSPEEEDRVSLKKFRSCSVLTLANTLDLPTGLKEPGDVSTTATPALDSKEEENDHTSSSHHKSHRIKSLGKRLIGRPPMKKSNSSLVSLASQSSIDSGRKAELGPVKDHHKHSKEHETEKDYQNSHTELIAQVTEWLNAEKERKRSKISGRTGHGLSKEKDRRPPSASGSPYVASDAGSERLGSESELSENTDALEKLEKILAENMALHTRTPAAITSGMMERRPSYSHGQRRSSLMRKLRRTSIAASSDTDHFDGDVIVPSCDVVLDNSKTMAYTGGTGEETPSAKLEDHKAQAEKEAWIHFKNEIIRLAHTLKLKNWRRVPLDRGSEIEVERLSGALTNAVYVISPPKSLPPQTEKNESSTLLSHKYPPP
jgi:choline kinase